MVELIGYIAFGLYAVANLAAVGVWVYAAWASPHHAATDGRLSGPRDSGSSSDVKTSGELAISGC